jgi:hypothetical protein
MQRTVYHKNSQNPMRGFFPGPVYGIVEP